MPVSFLALKMLCLFCWWMRKCLERLSVTIKFLFSYSFLGTLFRWKRKKKSCHYSAIVQLQYQRRDVSPQFTLRKNCPGIDIESQGCQKKCCFPCLMFRTRKDVTTQAWIWVWLIERDAVPFFKLTLAHSELEFVLRWCRYNCVGT